MPTYPAPYTDQQIADKLTREGVHWAETTITYSYNDFSTAGNALTLEQIDWIELAVTLFGDILALNFVNVASDGMLTFNGAAGGGTFASTAWFEPSNELTDGDIYFDQTWAEHAPGSYYAGSKAVLNIIHEFGHAMGLEHPGNYNISASYFVDAEFLQDTHANTVMSYFDAEQDGSGTSHFYWDGTDFFWLYPQTLMVYDILALSQGAFAGSFGGYALNGTSRSGNETYGYNATSSIFEAYDFTLNFAPIVTIFDGGGIDTLDLSGDTVSQSMEITYDIDGNGIYTPASRLTSIIDINEGAHSSTHGMDNNIGIAFGTQIENVVGTMFADTIYGNTLANTFTGGQGNDTINGDAGNDTFIFTGSSLSLGVDNVDGGANTDTADFTGMSTYAWVDLAYTGATGIEAWTQNGATWVQIANLTAVENVTGTSLSDQFFGNSQNNLFNGGSGNDQFLGRGGNDTLNGDSGNDTFLFSGSGLGVDQVNGGGNTDTANFTGMTTYAWVDLAYTGSTGIEAWTQNGTTWVQVANLTSIENVTGTSLSDQFFGDAIGNLFIGGAGNDQFMGRGGNDTLNGDAGNDTFQFSGSGLGVDQVNGGANTDTANFTGMTTYAWVDLAYTGATGIEAWTQSGATWVQVANLTAVENVTGTALGDYLVGDGLANLLMGAAGNDTLNGRAGIDTLNGGLGNDSLTGGTEGDIFRFADLLFGTDTIADWQDGVDKISVALNLESSFGGLALANNSSTAVTVSGFNTAGSIVVRAGSAFTLDASDFIFV